MRAIHGDHADSAHRSARSGHRGQDAVECRCLCGSLIARRVAGGVELKCRRCKRHVVLPLEAESDADPASAS